MSFWLAKCQLSTLSTLPMCLSLTHRDNPDRFDFMPVRFTPLANGQYYHIYNRGVAHQPVFSSSTDYDRLLLSFSYYRYNNLPLRLSKLLQAPREEREKIIAGLEAAHDLTVDIVAFCLMPNHIHILLKQVSEGGISKFMKQVTDSYTRYFNTKYQRVGPLFQGAFKAVRIENDEQLVHVSRYIHLNPVVSYIVRGEGFTNYPWSSLKDYLSGGSKLVDFGVILDHFRSKEEYLKFVLDQADYGKELERIKHLTLEK